MLADGTFDPLHVGHLRYLAAAAAFGSTLIVRVAPDRDILAKGRPLFQSQDERARLIGALRMVDDVCLHETLVSAVRAIQPTMLVKGRDWEGRLPDAVRAACLLVGTEIVYVDTQERTSSERIAR